MVQYHGLTPLFVDVENAELVEKAIDEAKPDVILHLAAISDPDYCERPENMEKVIQANYWGAINVFRAATARKIITVHISTSQIFSGRTFLGFGRDYRENDPPAKKITNQYALSKLTSEAARFLYNDRVKVIRTSHVFDYPRLMSKIPPTKVVNAPSFMKRSYIYLPHFADALRVYLANVTKMPDVLNVAGYSTVSEYELMRMFLQLMPRYGVKLKKRTHEIEGMAPRPHYSGLDVSLSRRLGLPQYNYVDGLLEMSRTVVRG